MKNLLALTLTFCGLAVAAQAQDETPFAGVDVKGFIAAMPKEFISNIKICKPSEYDYTHPLTGEVEQKIILGLEGNKCHFQETMPQNFVLDCLYPVDKLEQVAEDYQKSLDKALQGQLELVTDDESVVQAMMNNEEVCSILDEGDSDDDLIMEYDKP